MKNEVEPKDEFFGAMLSVDCGCGESSNVVLTRDEFLIYELALMICIFLLFGFAGYGIRQFLAKVN